MLKQICAVALLGDLNTLIGSRVVSHRFTMGDWKPAQTVKFRGKNNYDYDLHLWIISGDSKK